MSDSLETLAAKQAITEVLHRYCHAVDRIDADMGSKIWHPDGRVHAEGIFDGAGHDFMAFVLESHKSAEATSHQLTNILIDVDGDRASSRSYVTACVRAGGNDIIVRGRYSDSWSRRADEWRIEERTYCHDIVQVVPVGEQPIPTTEPPG